MISYDLNWMIKLNRYKKLDNQIKLKKIKIKSNIKNKLKGKKLI